MKRILVILTLLVLYSPQGFAQLNIGVGTRLKLVNNKYYYEIENSTSVVNLEFNQPSFEVVGRTSNYKTKDSSKFEFGYTFEVGLLFSGYKMTTYNVPDISYWEPDTVGSYRIEYNKLRKLNISNFFDVRYKINDRLTLVNSFGLKIENRDGDSEHKKLKNYSSYLFEADNYVDDKKQERDLIEYPNFYGERFPIHFRLVYLPQLIFDFNQFSLNVQLYQDLININSYFNKMDTGIINYSSFTGIGLILVKKAKQDQVWLDNN
ncbi:MAG: hypothetical protein ACWA41_09715 [Putridiphycobacter sp.]